MAISLMNIKAKRHMKYDNLCTCGKKISNNAKSCKSCFNKNRGSWGNHSVESKLKQSKLMKEWYKNNEHPKGFLGKERTVEYLEKRSKLFSGEGNPNWQGGINQYSYGKGFHNTFKRLIRKRDNQVCVLCGIHREKLDRALAIHHIDYNKQLSIPQNCVSLCDCCHGKTGQNRKHWIKLFQNILSDKYDYKYVNNEIMVEIK